MKPSINVLFPVAGDGLRFGGCFKPLLDATEKKFIELAKEQNIAPYLIFHDTALIHMVKQRPQTLEDMSKISGVGAMKLDKYGEVFLCLLIQ